MTGCSDNFLTLPIMVKYSNFLSDQKIYSTDVLEYLGIWSVLTLIHGTWLRNFLSAKCMALQLGLAEMVRSDFPSSVDAELLG